MPAQPLPDADIHEYGKSCHISAIYEGIKPEESTDEDGDENDTLDVAIDGHVSLSCAASQPSTKDQARRLISTP
jgi:hypothetical protein